MAAIIKDMAQIASECIKRPRGTSVWSPDLNRYFCPESEDGEALLARAQPPVLQEEPERPTLGKEFKIVFVSTVTLTVLFLALCVVLTLLAGKEPPPLYEKLVTGLFDLVKIGAGTFLGLLGGKRLQA